jgi:hypothetical protein
VPGCRPGSRRLRPVLLECLDAVPDRGDVELCLREALVELVPMLVVACGAGEHALVKLVEGYEITSKRADLVPEALHAVEEVLLA